MQGAMDRMLEACDNYALQSAKKKSEVVYHPAPTITVNGQKLHVVDRFTYLGSALSRAVQVTARTEKSSVAFG